VETVELRQASKVSEDAATLFALRLQTRRLQMLNHIAKAIASDLDLERVVQTVTDAATEIAGAKFGAFFYNVTNAAGESYVLYSLSGASRESFEKMGLPRNTAVFAPTFSGTATIRSDDIRADPRYGQNAPHFGMPAGHLPVVSYLAVPVVSRSGEVLGGLFFGHDEAGVFTPESQELVESIASHAATAIDNARLIKAAREDIVTHQRAQESASWLAAIVESSDDAILSKDLNGVITSWNNGAERLFGYIRDEVIGKPVSILIPEDRQDEEPRILERIRRGERIEHYETIRRHKDGSLIDISLSVSPVRNAEGAIIGASKIARDITGRKRAEEQRSLLMREMNHRIKNLFTLATGVVTLSARTAETPAALAAAIRERLMALARTHDLILPQLAAADAGVAAATTLTALLKSILLPYQDKATERMRISGGDDIIVGARSLANLALLLHEFATNAAKYGALSVAEGQITIEIDRRGDEVELIWTERNGPAIAAAPETLGFGSRLERGVQSQLGARIERDWQADGLVIRFTAPYVALAS